MHTRSCRPSFRSFSLPGLALLPLLIAAVVLAVTASESPPAAPGFPSDTTADPAGGVFVFSSTAGTATIRFSTVPPRPPETLGYRLYLGSVARDAGTPYALGNTPCDLGTATTTGLQTCFAQATSQSVYMAVTAYNEYGNEGDYSQAKIFVPVTPPTITSVTPNSTANSREMNLVWTRGSAPSNIAGVVVETEIFRRLAGAGPYTKLTIPSNATAFPDSGLDLDSSYEYTFRSKATPPAVDGGSPAIITYSAVTAAQIRSNRIPDDVFNVSIPGNRGSGNPVAVTTLGADEVADVDQVSGNVVFAPGGGGGCNAPCTCNANPNGISQGVYDDDLNELQCYANDYCNPDPSEGVNHAALLLKIGSAGSQGVGTGGGSFTGNGSLVLFVNDCSPTNNSNSFSARVTVSKQ